MSAQENNDDDDPVELSAHALNALNEFYREQAELTQNDISPDDVDEDWELSQFWYDEETSRRLADECLRLIGNSQDGNCRIACVSCPTLFKTLLRITDGKSEYENVALSLFEYDNRFERYENFVFYDYRQPLDELWQRTNNNRDGIDFRRSFDVVVIDPPFLSEECIGRVAELVRALVKPKLGRIIFCTGAVAENFLLASLDRENMKMCETFEPRHKRKLGNEFRCYVNYEGAFF